jgi:hypothetical protein
MCDPVCVCVCVYCSMAFANMVEVPLASEFKLVVYKQVDAGFYSTASYVFSVILMHMPLAIAECFIFGTLLYWMAFFTADAGNYFFFLLVTYVSSCSGDCTTSNMSA